MKRIRTIVIGIICIGLVVGYYYYLTHKAPSKDESEVTEVQKIILKDLTGKSYPATPREVIKFYNRILKCYYNEDYTDEELRKLTDQALVLMDEELADNNPPEQYFGHVEEEVGIYRAQKRTINNTSVCSSNDVKFKTIDKEEYAYVTATYFVRDKDGFSKTGQNYILRKDPEDKWKILAFQLQEGDADNNE